MEKRKTSFKLSPEATDLLARLAEKLGIPRSSVLEVLIRAKAEELALRTGP